MRLNRRVSWITVVLLVVGASACGKKSPSGSNEVCGDGLVTTSEGCDDGNLVGGDGCDELCVTESGWTCADEPSACEAVCGDDLALGSEACDGADLAAETCATLGLESGDLACDSACEFDVSGCVGTPECGNDAVEFPESCDGSELDGETCVGLGFAGGTLNCETDCTFDTSACDPLPTCGNGSLDGGEYCDGVLLAGQTCVTLGWDSGDLDCGVDCTYDTSGCIGSGPVCGDGQVEGLEVCDDGNTDDCDGCRSDCSAVETGCGDGFLCGAEVCDDGNTADCDGCRADCSAAETGCGDGFTCGAEACDDGNTDDCDGCRGDCAVVETGCGDGALCGAEECDDGNLAVGDGCGPTCLTEVCGNGYVDPGEICDDGNQVSCDGCEVNCMPHPGCGDGIADCGEQCDDGNMDNNDVCLNNCLLNVCGDGFLNAAVEECDQFNFGGATCGSLGHDGGNLSCTANCNVDEGACVDCPAGLTYCAGACVDVMSDNDHCGGCGGGPCAGATVCIGGLCEPLAQPWSPVGQNPLSGNPGSVLAHDLATDGAQLTVAYVQDAGGGNRQVRVVEYSGAVAWNGLGASPSGLEWLDEAVSLAYDGATPFVAFGGGPSGPWGAIRVMFYQAGVWLEVGAPGFPSACGVHMFIDMALDGATPHLTSMGAGGCGIGVDYGWFDGAVWQTHPSTTGFPGQLTMSGQGNPAIVYNNEALIGLADWDTVDPTTIHAVKYWDGGGNAWADLDGELDMNIETGWEEHMALALDPSAALYTAWVESDGGAPATDDIYVKRHDATAGTWSLLGGGPINGAASATLPSITIIGTTPWVAYVETANTGVDHIRVRRFDASASTWELVGQPLNQDVTENATAPVIVSVGGVPHVAFREEVAGPGSAWLLYVKRFP